MDLCENCGKPLPEKADPLCYSCLTELGAAPYPPTGQDRIEAALARLAEFHKGIVPRKPDSPESAA
jgi:hypothetical protein